MDQSTEVTLTVTLETLQIIFAGLDELPGKFGRKVIAELDKQAVEQLQKMQQDADQ